METASDPRERDGATPAVRRGRVADCEVVEPLWAEMMQLHRALDPRFRPAADAANLFRRSYRALVTDRHACVLVAEEAGAAPETRAVVGYAIGTIRVMHEQLEPRVVGYVTDISVAPAARRRGIGGALVAELRNWYHQQGITTILLRVSSMNPASLGFWEAMGWREHMREMWWQEGRSESEPA